MNRESDAEVFQNIVDNYHLTAKEPDVTPVYSGLEIAAMSGNKAIAKYIGRWCSEKLNLRGYFPTPIDDEVNGLLP